MQEKITTKIFNPFYSFYEYNSLRLSFNGQITLGDEWLNTAEQVVNFLQQKVGGNSFEDLHRYLREDFLRNAIGNFSFISSPITSLNLNIPKGNIEIALSRWGVK